MRKNLSIIGLCLQGTLFRILGVLVIMMTAEIGIFYFKLQSFDRVLPLFEDIADCLPIKLCWIFVLSYVVYAAFDFLTRKNNLMSAYTVARLSVKETTMYLMIALFNLFAIIIAWAVQVGTLILMGQIYIAANTAAPYSPVLFLAFYRSSFLHVLLPLGDIMGWIVVFLIWAALALSASVAIKKMYYTKKPSAETLQPLFCSLL